MAWLSEYVMTSSYLACCSAIRLQLQSQSVTPSSCGTVIVSKVGLSKDKPEKLLTFCKMSSGGRKNYGRITTSHKGFVQYSAFKKAS